MTHDTERARAALLAFFRAEGITLEADDHFFTPAQWALRAEAHGNHALLVVQHDGGPLAPYFNWDYEDGAALQHLNMALTPLGFYAEQCTSWYSGIYCI